MTNTQILSLSNFWPIIAPSRTWNVSQYGVIDPQLVMTIENITQNNNFHSLKYTNRPFFKNKTTDANIENYHNKSTNLDITVPNWVWLDSYEDIRSNISPIKHLVSTQKALFTDSNGHVTDLLECGLYKEFNEMGQPYLPIKLPRFGVFRLQVWGPVIGANIDTYIDKLIFPPENPNDTRIAVGVKEAYWTNSTLKRGSDWNLGNGSIGSDGLPSGENITYGRKVYHANGQIPYFIGGTDTHPYAQVTTTKFSDIVTNGHSFTD
jgi:hypothetical protein